jgi:hypothetical protein
VDTKKYQLTLRGRVTVRAYLTVEVPAARWGGPATAVPGLEGALGNILARRYSRRRYLLRAQK